MAPPVPAVSMKKIHLILLVLLSGVCLACQPDPAKVRVERALTASWQSYCRHFIKSDGQVIIPEEGGGTISEAQAYALLRAVWAQDAPVFSRVYAWTYKNLSRVQSHRATTCWPGAGAGSRAAPGGCWMPTAPPTATWIMPWPWSWRTAWAGNLPNFPDYGETCWVQADILAEEVVALPAGDLLLTPGNWHELKPPYLLNPSYFSPAAVYRLFESDSGTAGRQGGTGHVGAVREPPLPNPELTNKPFRWDRLRQSTYKLLGQLNEGLGSQTGVGLFPDWCRVDAAGRLTPAPGKDTRYGWEAVRLPFRVALDGLWFGGTTSGAPP